jgi:hypothetical protein
MIASSCRAVLFHRLPSRAQGFKLRATCLVAALACPHGHCKWYERTSCRVRKELKMRLATPATVNSKTRLYVHSRPLTPLAAWRTPQSYVCRFCAANSCHAAPVAMLFYPATTVQISPSTGQQSTDFVPRLPVHPSQEQAQHFMRQGRG